MVLEKLSSKTGNTKATHLKIINIINQLESQKTLSELDYLYLLNNLSIDEFDYLKKRARLLKEKYYGNTVFLRGLIELTNYCKQNCFYCGIRAENKEVERYRLSKEEILETIDYGVSLNFETIVMQGGEDAHFDVNELAEVIKIAKTKYPHIAITLSLGELKKEEFQILYNAGGDRYLLRHEAASQELYDSLHPKNMSHANRIQCLSDLKNMGFQVGGGFMVNSPNQTNEHIVQDFKLFEKLQPHMVGIGPFIKHNKTPFKDEQSGNELQTIACVAITRLILPKALLPATTALGTIKKGAREIALNSGANVVMPNLSPLNERKKYEIYENKIGIYDESAEMIDKLEASLNANNLVIDMSRGDHKDKERI